MRRAACLLVLASLTMAGCSAPTEPSPRASAEPSQSASASAAPGAKCEAVEALGKAIITGQQESAGAKYLDGAAIRSADFDKVWFVAVKFSALGVDDQTGVWASNSTTPGEGAIMAVDGIAQQFTTWPAADSTAAKISAADPGVAAAKACLK